MRDWMVSLLQKRTGQDVDAWNTRIARQRLRDEGALRRWLAGRRVSGYAQRLLVWERFGYPSFMTAGVDDLLGRQYADRPRLRPILDAVLAALPEIGQVMTVQARKTYVSLVSGRRTFAVVRRPPGTASTWACDSRTRGPVGACNLPEPSATGR